MITIDVKTLQKSFNNLLPAAGRHVMPVLANVTLTFLDGQLTLTANDLDTSIRESLQAKGGNRINVAVAHKALKKALSNLKPGTVDIIDVPEKYQVQLVQGSLRQTLRADLAAEQPTPRSVEGVGIGCTANELTRLLEPVMFAVSADTARPQICGVNLHVRGERLRAVTTDGHRLVLTEAKSKLGAPDKFVPSLLQKPGVLVLLKALSSVKPTAEVTIYSTSTHTTFTIVDGEPWRVVTVDVKTVELPDGRSPPDYEQILPNKYWETGSAVFNRKDLLDALKPVEIRDTTSPSGTRPFKFNVGAQQAVFTVHNVEDGVGIESSVKCELTGKELVTGFHAGYLIEALQAIETTDVCLRWQDKLSPLTIEPRPQDDLVSLTTVTMPANL